MSKVEIVAYAPHHLDAILELQKRLWSPSTEMNGRCFQWKFIDNPHAQAGAVFVALADGRVVGMRGFTGSRWRDPDGGLISIPLAGDTVVASDHEGLGIVNRLTEAARSEFARRGIAMILNTSASPAVYLHSSRAGWKTIGTYAHMRRGPRPGHDQPLRQRLRTLWPGRARASVDPCAAANGKTWRHEGSAMRLQAAANPDEMSVLCSRMAPSPAYGMVRDLEFFRWRFSNPLRTYYFLTAWKGGNLEAYLALSVRMVDDEPDVRIVDWHSLARPQFRRLLQALARFVPDVAVNMLVNACTDDERHDLLAEGFREITPDPPVGRFAHRPGVLGMATQADSPSFRRLSQEGFALLEFKGIESDGA